MTALDRKIAGLPAESRERALQGSDALIAAETCNQRGLRRLRDGAYRQAIADFSEAQRLHAHFYHNDMSPELLSIAVAQTHGLINRLLPLTA